MHKYRNQIIGGLALTFAIYTGLLIATDTSTQFGDGVLAAIRDFPAWLVPALILTQVSAGFFRFLEWHYYLGVIEARDKISLKDSIVIFVATFTMAVSPGKVAEVLKSVLLKMKTGVLIARSAPVVLAERVVDGLAVIVTLTLTLLFASDLLMLNHLPEPLTLNAIRGLIFTSAALLLGGLVIVQIKPLAYFCLRSMGMIPLLRRLQKPLTIFYESSREVFQLRHVIPTTIMGMGVYASSTLGFVLVLWGFDVAVTPTLIAQLALIVGVASAIGALSFVPNGAGVTEVSNYALLMALVAPANPELTPAVAGAAALIQGFFHKWFRVIVGMGVAFIYRRQLFTTELNTELAMLDNTSPQPEAAGANFR
ncbi:flippase-like domain-containing protein [bacterium]|nr:flippase-like domain-containing protein [bacterium]